MDNEVSLREYIEARLRELKRTIDLKYQTTEKATLLATYALEKRLESMNEFREAMKDQAQKFLTKNEFDIRHRRMEEEQELVQRGVDPGAQRLIGQGPEVLDEGPLGGAEVGLFDGWGHGYSWRGQPAGKRCRASYFLPFSWRARIASISSMMPFISAMALLKGSEVVMSTPAPLRRSMAGLELPEESMLR